MASHLVAKGWSKGIAGLLLILIAVAFSIMAGVYAGKASEMSVKPQSVKRHGYCLFTWPGKSGDVCFAIIPKYKAEKYKHNWFAKWDGECGVPLLRQELSALPNGEYVEWLNLPPKFTYPQRQVSEDLVDYGKKIGLDFRMNPGLDQRMFPDWP